MTLCLVFVLDLQFFYLFVRFLFKLIAEFKNKENDLKDHDHKLFLVVLKYF